MAEERIQQNVLGTEKISRLLVKFAVPGIVSMVINALYNIVDQIFIGRGVGYLGNGATNVIFPLVTLSVAFALLIGDGTASFVSLRLGEGEYEKASKGATCGLISLVIAGCSLAAIYILFMGPLCMALGATDKILPYAKDYGYIIAIGIPFACFDAGFASVIRADGSPKITMIGLISGCILNTVLDPIFIFVFHWGVKGAALATIIGQIANAFLYIWYARHTKHVEINRKTGEGCMRLAGTICALGVSSFINQAVTVILIAVQNNLLRDYGALSAYGPEIPMTALGVTMKIFGIIMSVGVGLSGGAMPIWGYNYGSKQYDRVKETFRLVLITATSVMVVAWILFQVMPMTFVSIFGSKDDLYNQFSVLCLRVFLGAIPFTALQMMSGVFFQALGRPMQATILSLSRQVLLKIPATIILPIFLGVEGVLWAGPVSDIGCMIVALVMLKMYWKKMFDENR